MAKCIECCDVALEVTVAFGKGTGQGVANTVNGIQDTAIGVVNIAPLAYNYTGGLLFDKKIGYIPSPDWSYNLVTRESEISHNISKFLGGESSTFLITVGLSKVGAVSKLNKAANAADKANDAKCASKCVSRTSNYIDNAAAASDDFTNLASNKRTTHLLKGDKTGGGHMWPGKPGKSVFPKDWSADKIMHEVSDIVTDPKLDWIPGRKVRGLQRYTVEGVRDGVKVKAIIEPAGEGIITAWPIK